VVAHWGIGYDIDSRYCHPSWEGTRVLAKRKPDSLLFFSLSFLFCPASDSDDSVHLSFKLSLTTTISVLQVRELSLRSDVRGNNAPLVGQVFIMPIIHLHE
jgi:hypothetical protein